MMLLLLTGCSILIIVGVYLILNAGVLAKANMNAKHIALSFPEDAEAILKIRENYVYLEEHLRSSFSAFSYCCLHIS